MGDLLAALMAVAASMANVAQPPTAPEVKLISSTELQVMACGAVQKCPNLHFFTAPDTGVIYVTSGVDFKYTFAKAELFHEVARYVLAQNKIYSPKNDCLKTVKQEEALSRMEFDYIMGEVKKGVYMGVGIPPKQDMPKHVFFCVPVDPPKTLNEALEQYIDRGGKLK